MHDPNTFSSEIGDVHERPARRDSFSDEFRGVAVGRGDSFSNEFEGVPEPTFHDRPPPRPLEVARRGRRVLTAIIVTIVVVGVGGALFWTFSTEIGLWIAGLGTEGELEVVEVEPGAEGEGEGQPAGETQPEGEGEPDKAFGIKGVPGDGDEGPAPQPSTEPSPPAEPAPPAPAPAPITAPAKVSVSSTSVRGKVGSGRVESKLKGADEALASCWAEAAAKGATRPAQLSVEFRIKWNGRRSGLSFEGGTPALESCVSKEIPNGGWPQPRDGGEAKVTRVWSLS